MAGVCLRFVIRVCALPNLKGSCHGTSRVLGPARRMAGRRVAAKARRAVQSRAVRSLCTIKGLQLDYGTSMCFITILPGFYMCYYLSTFLGGLLSQAWLGRFLAERHRILARSVTSRDSNLFAR